jgi:hypothetical protein
METQERFLCFQAKTQEPSPMFVKRISNIYKNIQSLYIGDT